jgi:N-acetylglucosamine-6-phosphate deacetylase
VPGLIDLQVNGCFGVDLAGLDPAGWAHLVGRLPETGTTAFLPTFVTAPVGELRDAVRFASVFAADPPAGARVLGVHLEGPFLAPSRAGAHRRDLMVPPTPAMIADLLAAGAGVLRMDRAVANTVAAGVGLAEAVAAATRVPADLIGRPDLGRLTPGAAADLAWLGDDLRARATWMAGEQV